MARQITAGLYALTGRLMVSVAALLVCACVPPIARYDAKSLALQPAFVAVAPGERIDFNVLGGNPPFTFAVAANSGATVDEQGHYVAGPTGDTEDVVSVRDGSSLVAEARIVLSSALRIAVANSDVAPRQQLVIVAAGGKPPYAFSVASNGSGATIDALTGRYVAGETGETVDLVSVKDANGQERSMQLVVGARLQAALAKSLATPLTLNKLVVSGGLQPYVFAFAPRGDHSDGSLDAITGDYVPGLNAGTTDTLSVRDATGSEVRVSVQVGALAFDAVRGTSFCQRADIDGDGDPEMVIPRSDSFSTVRFPVDSKPEVRTLPGAVLAIGRFDFNFSDDLVIDTSNGPTIYFGDPAGYLVTTETPPQLGTDFQGGSVYSQLDGTLYWNTNAPGGLASLDCASGCKNLAAFEGTPPTQYLLPYAWGSRVFALDGYNLLSEGQVGARGATDPITFSYVPMTLPSGGGGIARVNNASSDPSRFLPLVVCENGSTCEARLCSVESSVSCTAHGFTVSSPAGIDEATYYRAWAASGAPARVFLWDGIEGNIVSYAVDGTPQSRPMPDVPFQVDCAVPLDGDHDGIEDLALSSFYTPQGALAVGEGDGSFARRPRYHAIQAVHVVRDLDGDGQQDAVIVRPAGDVAVFLGAEHELSFVAKLEQAAGPIFVAVDHFLDDTSWTMLLQTNTGAWQLVPMSSDGRLAAPQAAQSVSPVSPNGIKVLADFGGPAPGPDLFYQDLLAQKFYAIVRQTPLTWQTLEIALPGLTLENAGFSVLATPRPEYAAELVAFSRSPVFPDPDPGDGRVAFQLCFQRIHVDHAAAATVDPQFCMPTAQSSGGKVVDAGSAGDSVWLTLAVGYANDTEVWRIDPTGVDVQRAGVFSGDTRIIAPDGLSPLLMMRETNPIHHLRDPFHPGTALQPPLYGPGLAQRALVGPSGDFDLLFRAANRQQPNDRVYLSRKNASGYFD